MMREWHRLRRWANRLRGLLCGHGCDVIGCRQGVTWRDPKGAGLKGCFGHFTHLYRTRWYPPREENLIVPPHVGSVLVRWHHKRKGPYR